MSRSTHFWASMALCSSESLLSSWSLGIANPLSRCFRSTSFWRTWRMCRAFSVYRCGVCVCVCEVCEVSVCVGGRHVECVRQWSSDGGLKLNYVSEEGVKMLNMQCWSINRTQPTCQKPLNISPLLSCVACRAAPDGRGWVSLVWAAIPSGSPPPSHTHQTCPPQVLETLLGNISMKHSV